MLKRGAFDKFKETFEKYISSALSNFDLGCEEPERVYKVFLLGILSIAINGFVVESEMESGYGRLDVVVYPKSEKYGRYAVIFEAKRADDEEELENLASEALRQIRERKYFAKIKNLGYDVIAFGVVFSGKRVKISAEII